MHTCRDSVFKRLRRVCDLIKLKSHPDPEAAAEIVGGTLYSMNSLCTFYLDRHNKKTAVSREETASPTGREKASLDDIAEVIKEMLTVEATRPWLYAHRDLAVNLKMNAIELTHTLVSLHTLVSPAESPLSKQALFGLEELNTTLVKLAEKIYTDEPQDLTVRNVCL